MYVVSVGNPFDGLILYGPFADHGDALEYVETEDLGDWTIVTLSDPAT